MNSYTWCCVFTALPQLKEASHCLFSVLFFSFVSKILSQGEFDLLIIYFMPTGWYTSSLLLHHMQDIHSYTLQLTWKPNISHQSLSISMFMHTHCIAGGLQVNLPHLPEGWLLQSLEGELCHHGASHPVRCHPVLCTWAVQNPVGRLLWLSGEVSVRLNLMQLLYDFHPLSCEYYKGCLFSSDPGPYLHFQGYWLGLWPAPQQPCWPILWTWCELEWLWRQRKCKSVFSCEYTVISRFYGTLMPRFTLL